MKIATEIVEELRTELRDIEADMLEQSTRYTLADAIEEGSRRTGKAAGWGANESACALAAASIALKARGYI